jgi:hypothetical protein
MMSVVGCNLSSCCQLELKQAQAQGAVEVIGGARRTTGSGANVVTGVADILANPKEKASS